MIHSLSKNLRKVGELWSKCMSYMIKFDCQDYTKTYVVGCLISWKQLSGLVCQWRKEVKVWTLSLMVMYIRRHCWSSSSSSMNHCGIRLRRNFMLISRHSLKSYGVRQRKKLKSNIRHCISFRNSAKFKLSLWENVYCDLLFASNGHMGKMYEVREDVVYAKRRKKKIFIVLFNRGKCEMIHSCHLFKFRENSMLACDHSVDINELL